VFGLPCQSILQAALLRAWTGIGGREGECVHNQETDRFMPEEDECQKCPCKHGGLEPMGLMAWRHLDEAHC